MLELQHVSKTYEKSKVRAIDDISLTIGDGEIFGFIGPNGAGKSTCIKSIVGIHSFEGEILLNGLSVKKDEIAFKKQIAYVPDNPDLYEHLSGVQYIDFIANVYGVGEEKNERIHRYSSLFGIEERLADPIKTYSHGMKQKVALIAALCHEPKLLVLDEPFVGLDPKAAHELKEVMKGLCAEGKSIFFSSHVLEVVEKLCDRLAIIKDGKIVASGKTEEIAGDSLENKFLELFDA